MSGEMLLGFWCDIKNVERASAEDIQSDIIAYIAQALHYKELAEKRGKALERIANQETQQRNYSVALDACITIASQALGKES